MSDPSQSAENGTPTGWVGSTQDKHEWEMRQPARNADSGRDISPYRKMCGRCGERPPIQVEGWWIDYCAECYWAWLDWLEASPNGR